MTNNKLNLIKAVFDMTIQSCQDDTAYNDNTLHDLLIHGFKGFEHMSEQELQAEYEYLIEGRE